MPTRHALLPLTLGLGCRTCIAIVHPYAFAAILFHIIINFSYVECSVVFFVYDDGERGGSTKYSQSAPGLQHY